MKILHRHGVAGTSEELLQREFRILAKLIHPNLVLLFRAIVTTDGRQGQAMEWIDGWPLDDWLDQHPDLPLARKLELFHGMVRGVAFLHENGVIHRDLKPANVIVDAHGVAKIVDFGLARLHQEEAASGMDGGSMGVSGTLHFMAPEQAANGKGSRAMPVDVYALGLMLYRMLTGRWLRPCRGTAAETLAHLCKILDNYLKNQHRHATAQMRGGKRKFESLDTTIPTAHQEESALESNSPLSLDTGAYDRHWAQHILRLAFSDLERGTQATREMLPVLRPWILADPGDATLKEIAGSMGRTHAALRARLHRLRKVRRQAVRDAVAQTVAHPDEIDDELRHLAAVHSRHPLE